MRTTYFPVPVECICTADVDVEVNAVAVGARGALGEFDISSCSFVGPYSEAAGGASSGAEEVSLGRLAYPPQVYA